MAKILIVNNCNECGHYNFEYGDCLKLDRDVDYEIAIPKDCPLEDYSERSDSDIKTLYEMWKMGELKKD